jgi:pilus assembly protein Flp/PilA
MLKYYIKTREALLRLRTDKDGVVSFEYVIVGALVCAAVALAFGTGGANVASALNRGITSITNHIP